MALGTIGAGAAFHLPLITTIGKGFGIAALTLWTITACWNGAVLIRGSLPVA